MRSMHLSKSKRKCSVLETMQMMLPVIIVSRKGLSQGKVELSTILDDVAGRHHGGYERGHGVGYSRRLVWQFYSYSDTGIVDYNSSLQEQLNSVNQKFMELQEELQHRAEEAEREKAREKEEAERRHK